MLSSIISFSLKNKLIIGLLTIGLIFWGTYSFQKLPIDAVPDITNNQVQVISVAPDLAAPEVERLITFPIEQALASIPGKIELRSFSRFGLSLVTIVFTDETDIYWARQQVTEKLSQAKDLIPAGLTSPELAPVTTGLGEIYQYTLKVDEAYKQQYSLSDLRTIQDWIIRRQLLGTVGVADISSFGGLLKQYEVSLDPNRLRSMGVGLDEVFSALSKNNQNSGGSYIEKGPEAWLIRTEGLITSQDDIEQIVVHRTNNGIPVLIRDIAEINEGSAIRYGAMTRDSSGEAVGGVVLMLKGANSSTVIEDVKKRIAAIEASLPPGITIDPYLDRTKLVEKAIGTVSKNLTEGALIVIFVLVIMLGNLRAGLIVASVIPLSMLFALGMMNLFGVSGNLMSLGAIDFGLIVDGAVIIVEAVIHMLHKRYHSKDVAHVEISKQELNDSVATSADRMMRFAAFGQLIILIVYMPILSLVGIEGKMFKPMAETVSFAIIGALILSLTWVPVASATFLSRKISFKKGFADWFIEKVSKGYQPLLTKALAYPKSFLGGAIGMLILSFLVFSSLGGEFVPSLDEGDFSVETRLLTGSSLSESIRVSNLAGKILLKEYPEVIAVTGKIGTAEIPTDPMPIEATDLIISLKDRSEWTSASSREELAEKMGESLAAIPGVTFGFQQPIQMRFNELMTGARQDVVVKVFGEDMGELTNLAGKILKIARKVDGAVDFYEEQVSGLPQIVVKIDRAAVARYGVSVEDVNRAVNTAFAGSDAGFVYEGEKRFALVVRLPQAERNEVKNLEKLFVTGSKGEKIPLDELADIVQESGPVQIQREDARRRIIVGFNVRNRDVESVVNELRAEVSASLKLPVGYSVTYGGQFENLVQASRRLSIAVPVSLLLIFLLLFFAFKSVKYALLIFSAVPFSAIGGVLALYFRDLPFSISAGVGFIALFGVAVLNGIVLIGAFNQLKDNGMTDLKERIRKGTEERLRPILMTAFVASLGFLPMAISETAGAEVQRPLATVVIGGLISATLLTLVILPVLYMMIEKRFSARPLVMLALVALIPTSMQAQTQVELPLDSVLAMAKRNHLKLEATRVELKAAKALEPSAFDLGNFSAGLMGGQYNSNYSDFQFSFQQSIPFPGAMIRKKQLLTASTYLKSLELGNEERLVERELSALWYSIALLKSRILLIDSSSSTIKDLVEISKLRVKAGETISLETMNMEQKLGQRWIERNALNYRLIVLEHTLQKLIGGQTQVSTATWKFGSRPEYKYPADAIADVSSHPLMRIADQTKELSLISVQVERSKLFPELNLGYFNQSLVGVQTINGQEQFFNRSDRFSGYTLGLSFPLWFRPQASRVKQASFLAQAEELKSDFVKNQFQIDLEMAISQLNEAKSRLDFLEKEALPTAERTLANARLAWQSGNASYLELLHALDQHYQMQSEWFVAVQAYASSITLVNYLQP